MDFIWQEFLFRPLLNALILLYNSIGLDNLGLAIVWLTVIIRLLLLPVTLKEGKRKHKEFKIQSELAGLKKSYGNNPSVLREEQRRMMRSYRFRRWPRLLSLAVQGLVLVILYQVFVGGVQLAEIVDQLYSFVHVPITINTVFLGIDIAQRSIIMSLIPALILFGSIYFEYKYESQTEPDLVYLLAFPIVTFGILWYLPSVKALFVLSSQVFTLGYRFIKAFRTSVKEHDTIMSKLKEERDTAKQAGIPHPKDRF